MSSTLVINAFGENSVASFKGTLKVMLTDNVELVVPNVLNCKEVDANNLSVEHLVREGLTVQVDQTGAHLFKQAGKIYSGTYQDGSYLVHATVTYQLKEPVQALATKAIPELTHARFVHASVPYLKGAGLPAVANGFCIACSAGKQTRRHVKKQTSFITSFKPKNPLSKIHVDTAGPYRRSIDGQRYFVTILDGFTRYLSVVVVKKKSAIASRLIDWINQKENQVQQTLQCIRTDKGRNFLNDRLRNYMKQKGIKHEESITNQPNENGAVERQRRTLKESARCLLLATNSPPFLWSFAVQYAADIWNSLPRKSKNKPPLELFCGQVPDYNRFYVIGSHGFVKHPKKKLKFNGNVPCVYLGLSQSSKGFRVFLPRQRKLGTVRDIEVDEVGSFTKSRRKFWRSTLGVFDTMCGSGLALVFRNRREKSDTEVAVFTDLDDEVVNPSSDDCEMVVNTENAAPENFTDLSRSNILPKKRRDVSRNLYTLVLLG